jgi:hypothetical protein
MSTLEITYFKQVVGVVMPLFKVLYLFLFRLRASYHYMFCLSGFTLLCLLQVPCFNSLLSVSDTPTTPLRHPFLSHILYYSFLSGFVPTDLHYLFMGVLRC